MSQPVAAEEIGIDTTILQDKATDKPFGYIHKPLGYRDVPPGYREFPLGYREVPLQFSETPIGFREGIPNTLEEPRGYSPTPPRFIEREDHHLVNANDESLRQSPKQSAETAIAENFRDAPPGYVEVD